MVFSGYFVWGKQHPKKLKTTVGNVKNLRAKKTSGMIKDKNFS